MQKIVHFCRSNYKILGVGMLSLLTGIVISTLTTVNAAIPDTGGAIHGCRNTTTTMLRVIDSASQTCDGNESGLNWDQKGVRGYTRIISTGFNSYSLDTNRSYNVSNLHVANVSFNHNRLCFTVNGEPKNISLTPEDSSSGGSYVVAVKDSNGWTSSTGTPCDAVDNTTNVAIEVPNASFFVNLH